MRTKGLRFRIRYPARMRWLILASIALIVSACSPDAPPPSVTTTSLTVTTTTTLPSDEICKIGDLQFGEDGLVAALGEDVGDATTLSNIRWETSSTCERVTLSFASRSGAPAKTLGPTGVTVLSYASVIRIALPQELSDTAVADMLADGNLVDRVFVVRDDDGAMWVDIHGSHGLAIAARAFLTTSPSTLVIDIIASDPDAHPVGAALSKTAVVMTPPAGPTIYPFTVEGYAAPSEASTSVQLVEGDDVVSDISRSLPGWTDAWQAFVVGIADGPSGTIEIFVGSGDIAIDPDIGAIVVVEVP
jgi:hypothetical protein